MGVRHFSTVVLLLVVLCLTSVSQAETVVRGSVGPLHPAQEVLDLKDAPAPLVFILMLGITGDIDRRIQGDVTFRLTDRDIYYTGTQKPEEETGFSDYFMISGWLKVMETALHNGKLVVGQEREAGGNRCIYFASPPLPNESSFSYTTKESNTLPDSGWIRCSPLPIAAEQNLILTSEIPHFRVAGIHWVWKGPVKSGAVLLYCRGDGAEFGRLVGEGTAVTADLTVDRIEPNSVILKWKRGGLQEEPVRLALHARTAR